MVMRSGLAFAVSLIVPTIVGAQDLPTLEVGARECKVLEWNHHVFAGESVAPVFEIRVATDAEGIFPLWSFVAVDSFTGGGSSGNAIYEITASNQDAEEGADGTVNIDGEVMEWTEEPGTETGYDFQLVWASSDDARANAGEAPSYTSTSIYLGNQNNLVAFDYLDVPQGATITEATIQFRSKGTYTSDTPVMDIYGMDIDDVPTTNPVGTAVDAIPDYASKTTATVAWTIGQWSPEEMGVDTTTPDIKTIVQEIVDRPGWVAGSKMGFLFLEDTPQALRSAYSFDADELKTPVLRVDYTYGSGAGGGSNTIGLAFDGVAIPQGARIRSASVVPRQDADSDFNDAAVAWFIHGEASDDAADFAATADNISNRALTTNYGVWTEAEGDQFYERTESPQIASVVEEIVERPGWASGNQLALVITGTGRRDQSSWDKDSASTSAAQLWVIWSLDGEDVEYDVIRSKEDGSGGYWYRVQVDPCPLYLMPQDSEFYLMVRALDDDIYTPWSRALRLVTQ